MDLIIQKRKIIILVASIVSMIFVIFCGFVIQYSRSPDHFPKNVIVKIPSGSTVSQVADMLENKGIIRSHLAYKIYAIVIHDGSGIKAGSYLFDKPQSALMIAYRTAYGIQDLSKIKITIPEGSNSKDITKIISHSIPEFASTTFYTLAKEDEGYLFPDTYFFYQDITPEQAIDELRSNFDEHISAISSSTQSFSKKNKVTLDDIVTMASIVEKEANSLADRQIIAGILWRRYFDKYPLQVDPPFYYFLNKSSSQLTLADLAVDSPYNLYKHKGLTPTPIDNPGTDALYASVNPTVTKYWYYLSDKNGNMHYAVTYDQHLINKAKWVNI